MFSSLRSKLLLGVYVFIILSIPLGAYLVSQQQIFNTGAKQPKKDVSQASPSASLSPLKELQKGSENKVRSSPAPIPPPSPTPGPSTTVATSFGPTLSLKVNFEGRPLDNQAGSLFVGLFEGGVVSDPKFILSFTVDLPETGEYEGLSLAGLTPGSTYTALLKGPAQIATSSAFIMSTTVSNLNSGTVTNLLTGDLNDDNVINSADYAIAKNALGSNPTSSSWNEIVDFNLDQIINTLDLSYILKNFGKTGDSGDWVSPIPAGSASASLKNGVGGIETPTGYWLWVPR